MGYDDASSWMLEIIAECPTAFQIILVGTKADLWEELTQSGTGKQKAQLTTWNEGYDVHPSSLSLISFCKLQKLPFSYSFQEHIVMF